MNGMSEKEERDERNDDAYKAFLRTRRAKRRVAKKVTKTGKHQSVNRSTLRLLGLPIEHLPTIADLIGDGD